MSNHEHPQQPPDTDRRRRDLRGRLLGLVLRPTAPPLWLGITVAVTFIAAEAVLLEQLRQKIGANNHFGALFLLGVLVVSAGWGFRLAVATSLASTLAYMFVHLMASGFYLPMRPQDAAAVSVFLPIALLANVLVGQARLRAAESEHRRQEADLAAELARLILRAGDLHPALDVAGHRIARVLGLQFAALKTEAVPTDEQRSSIPLYDAEAPLGTLLVPADLPKPMRRRVGRLVPSLEALLAAARDREAINEALETSRKELERFFDLASDLLYIGGDIYLRRVNPAFERTFGYPASALTSRPFLEFIHPSDRIQTCEILEALLQGGAAQLENRCVRSDGAERWLEWSVVSESGLLYGAARDVTERRREQDRLREAQRMIEASHAEVSELAEQQAALRRVATIVARGVDPSEVDRAALTELSRGLGMDHAVMVCYEDDGAWVVHAVGGPGGKAKLADGERLSMEGSSVASLILQTGKPARLDSFADAEVPTAARVRSLGVHSAAGAPIVVDGRLRGALIVGSALNHSMPPETEIRIGDFADLVATAIRNAETRAELTASRARIVTAADQARRRFERDLHDGAQQRVVSIGLELRAAEASVPPDDQDLRDRISHIVTGLTGVSKELQAISRGIHPAILSKGGLGPAIKTLARRSATPVTLDLAVAQRMPESVEVAAYYVVAEALTNAAKHAQASEVSVRAAVKNNDLHLSISDDGIGGAVAGTGMGSGLIGLNDRVEALAGHLDISSAPGGGTTLEVTIPFGCEQTRQH